MTTLYRAAPEIDPHFGKGSYWTHSEAFARRFRLWLDEQYGSEHVVYRLDVDLTSCVLDVPFGVFLDPTKVSRAIEVGELALGYQWASFFEAGAFEGSMVRQYVYLGDAPLPAELAYR